MHASRSILSITSGRTCLWTLAIAFLLIGTFASTIAAAAESGVGRTIGTVLDPSGLPLAGANVKLDSASGARLIGTTGSDGGFTIALPKWGAYTVRLEALGFLPVMRTVDLSAAAASLTLRLKRVAGAADEVVVTGDVSDVTLTSPDPSEKVMVREELLDANPGRPGAPISLPGLPIETASGGIKAPQYFVRGAAGDHGEPIAQYIAVGGYLVTNNLSANAHGNGYAAPDRSPVPASLFPRHYPCQQRLISPVGANVSGRFSMAGFEVITYGRFWVIAEGNAADHTFTPQQRTAHAALCGLFFLRRS